MKSVERIDPVSIRAVRINAIKNLTKFHLWLDDYQKSANTVKNIAELLFRLFHTWSKSHVDIISLETRILSLWAELWKSKEHLLDILSDSTFIKTYKWLLSSRK